MHWTIITKSNSQNYLQKTNSAYGRKSNLNQTKAQIQKLGYFSNQTNFPPNKPQGC